MSSLIVDVCQVEEVNPHANADRLDIVRVKGWEVVTGRGTYKPGDKAVYFPPDTVISEELAERFGITNYVSEVPKNPDGTRPPGRRIRAKRLRGEQSFGFITKPDDPSWEIGFSVIDYYGASKFVPVERDGDEQNAPDMPNFHKYSDIENLKNFTNAFEDGEGVVITEKIHGMNARFGYVWSESDQSRILVCGSRTTRKRRPEEGEKPSIFWNLFAEEIRSLLFDVSLALGKVDVVVYGEIYGAKVQDLAYGLSTQKFRAFDISIDGRYLDYDVLNGFLARYGIESVPVLYRGPFSKEVVAQHTDGPTTLCDPEKNGKFKGREGIVIRPFVERYKNERHMNGRTIFKSVSIDYLERKNGTEYQ